jgi:hypothetical protein
VKPKALLLVALALMLAAPLVALRASPQQSGSNPHGDDRLECAQCHNAERWTPVDKTPGFRHEATGFALEGAHAKVACRDCHRSLVFTRIGTACADCHKDAHRGELGLRCESCHAPTSWDNQRVMYDRHSRSRFPLTGVHANVDCESCHRNQQPNQYATAPTDCGDCHIQSYLNAKNPNHAAGGFSRRCEDCHTANAWRPATGVDHNKTAFPLTGAHLAVSCARCHVGGRFAGTPTDCYSCHQANYAATTNPNHTAANLPRTCQNCHSTSAWQPASGIDHNKTRFPLTGAHQSVDCARCHIGGRFAGTPTDCYSCHQSNYNGTTNPNHQAAGFPTQCQNCHSTNAWTPASNIDHNKTRFPLTGAHRNVACSSCHVNGRFAGTPTDCYSCHQSSYAGTTNPNHQAAGFPTQCQNCHTTTAWTPATFNHNKTRFPLTGAHQSVDCARCHVNGRYAGTPTDCYSCHQSDYNGTNNPNHRASGFPTQCQNCHSTSSWLGAIFNHPFPITSGAHVGLNCTDCHTTPNNFRAFECILCHAHQKADTDSRHHDVGGYSYSSPACYRCHPNGKAGD